MSNSKSTKNTCYSRSCRDKKLRDYILENYSCDDDGTLYLGHGPAKTISTEDTRIGYARIWFTMDGKKRWMLKHRVLYVLYHGDFPKYETDHIDQNKLNNAKTNLRDVKRSENLKNRSVTKHKNASSKYFGVIHYKRDDCWYAKYRSDGKTYHIGSYPTEIDAAQAYDDYIIKNNIKNRFLNHVMLENAEEE